MMLLTRGRTEKVLRGIITLSILLELSKGPKHGYELQKRLAETLKDQLPSGSIYVLLGSLSRRGYIRVAHKQRVDGRIIVKYELTSRGRLFLKEHSKPLKLVRELLDQIIWGIDRL